MEQNRKEYNRTLQNIIKSNMFEYKRISRIKQTLSIDEQNRKKRI